MREKTQVMTVKIEEETNVRDFVDEDSVEVIVTNIKYKEGRIVKAQDLKQLSRNEKSRKRNWLRIRNVKFLT